MKIKKIQLKNGYKRFHDLTIDLENDPKRIVALVGENGCGKSSVFDAMLLLQSNYGAQIGNTRSKGYKYHSMIKSPHFNVARNVLIDFDQGDYVKVLKEKGLKGQEQTIFSFRSPYRYNSDLNITKSEAVSEIKQNDYGASSSSALDDKMVANYERIYVKYYAYLDKEDCPPSEAKRKIIGDINNALGNCLNLEMTNIGNIQSSRGTLYFKKPDHPNEFDFNVLSSGEKEVVDILLDLYLRQEDYNDTVFIIDEPELHINTSIQRKLLIEIDKIVGQNCQIWIATHSIGFLRALKEDFKGKCQIIHFPNGVEWANTAKTLTPIKETRSNWMEIFKTALDDLTNLISPERIIYCEGKHESRGDRSEGGLDAQVFNNIFSTEFQDTIFVSSGGNTELDQRSEIAINILYRVFKELEILVLKDRDISSGKFTSAQDRDAYLENNLKNHRVLRRLELENYLFDKEILQQYCADKKKNFQESDYDKFIIDIYNQNVKDEVGRIKNFCNIKTSINSDQFKINLSDYIKPNTEVYKELKECIFEPK